MARRPLLLPPVFGGKDGKKKKGSKLNDTNATETTSPIIEEGNFSKLSSETICALRFPLMVGIVFIHFNLLNGITVNGTVYGDDLPIWLVCIIKALSNEIPAIGVPLFFIISGFFFFRSGLTWNSYNRKLKKRARTLLVPYILWNLIALSYVLLCALPIFRSIFPISHIQEWSLPKFLYCFWDIDKSLLGEGVDKAVSWMNPVDQPLWYVRDLLIVMVFSPIINWALKKIGWYAIATMGLLWLLFVRLPLGHANYLLAAFFFFSWGACYALKGIDFVSSMRKYRFTLWIYPILLVAYFLFDHLGMHGSSFIHNAGIVCGVFAAVSLMARLVESGKVKPNKFLAESTFFLYAIHTIFIWHLAEVIVKLWFTDSPVYMCVLYFTVPILNIAISLALYWLLRRYAPRICAILTGGR